MRRINFTNTEVASSETARAINRGVILNLIRRRQPISRADLARVSGLQRSTVSQITEQLISEKWIQYGAVGRLPRGRRPTFLRLNDQRAIVVADIRPAWTTIAVADINGHFLAQQRLPTREDAEVAIAELACRIQQMMENHHGRTFEGVGITVPGRLDEATQRLKFAPNLKWHECDLKRPIEEATGLRVELDNAANACLLAEVWFGRAEHVHDLVVVTVSEGVGTGVFANGQLVRGSGGMAGEFGHVPLNPEGPPCTCGGRGCWEVYASNRAALRYYHESSTAAAGPTFSDLLDLAEAEDTLALRALEKMAHAIGKGMRMIVAGLAPEEILVVGEFTRLWSRLGRIIQAEIEAAALVGKVPRVRPTDDPGRARLHGAVAMVLQKHFGFCSPVSQEQGTQPSASTTALM
jgi:predicted NBD/HSP70 family sugar kinase